MILLLCKFVNNIQNQDTFDNNALLADIDDEEEPLLSPSTITTNYTTHYRLPNYHGLILT